MRRPPIQPITVSTKTRFSTRSRTRILILYLVESGEWKENLPTLNSQLSTHFMTFINYASREINCKIVYYGPGLCGKTTNLQHIYDSTAPQAKGKLISLATETDRTLFFDFMPLELGTVRGFKTRFHLYTVPGQVFYEASRKLILKGVDGLVFVADSQEE